MAKRLLNDETAKKKIELSLKLQGVGYSPEHLRCESCKFNWKNVPGGQPQWNPIFLYDVNGLRVRDANGKYAKAPNSPERPEKYQWLCFKYKNNPNHAYLRFNIIRTDKQGRKRHIYSFRQWDYNTQTYLYKVPEGEKDEIIFVKQGEKYRYHVCRRFEACIKR